MARSTPAPWDRASSKTSDSRAHSLPRPWRRRLATPRGRDTGWALIALVIAAPLALPTLAVLASAITPSEEIWRHLATTVLGEYVANTLWLVLGVGAGVLVIGVGAAWLVTMCHFPGRAVWEWALLLPMAMPAYLVAYTYTELLQFAGPVQGSLRAWFGWRKGDYWFPEIRSLEGAIVVMALVFYPYVYLLARAAFLQQPASLFETSRLLGWGPWRSFLLVAVPLARPAIAAGVALALMETLADFGTVQYFAVDTFTTGIYRTWFGMGSLATAAQLAAVLLLVVFVVLMLERLARGRARFHLSARGERPQVLFALTGPRAVGAQLACALPVLFGFALPTGVLGSMALRGGDARAGAVFGQLAVHSFALAATAAVLAGLIAFLLAYALRVAPNAVTRLATRVAVLGYAVPGAVIAVGILLAFGGIDRAIDQGAQASVGHSVGLVLSGSVVALILAYLVRFLAAGFNPVEASLTKIAPSLDEASRTLGHGPGSTLLRIHLPLLRGGLLTAAMLVFVEVLKELPATLVVRPFNFDTLAIRVYRLASDERLAEASTAALTIVGVGLLPVIVLSWAIARTRARPAAR